MVFACSPVSVMLWYISLVFTCYPSQPCSVIYQLYVISPLVSCMHVIYIPGLYMLFFSSMHAIYIPGLPHDLVSLCMWYISISVYLLDCNLMTLSLPTVLSVTHYRDQNLHLRLINQAEAHATASYIRVKVKLPHCVSRYTIVSFRYVSNHHVAIFSHYLQSFWAIICTHDHCHVSLLAWGTYG